MERTSPWGDLLAEVSISSPFAISSTIKREEDVVFWCYPQPPFPKSPRWKNILQHSDSLQPRANYSVSSRFSKIYYSIRHLIDWVFFLLVIMEEKSKYLYGKLHKINTLWSCHDTQQNTGTPLSSQTSVLKHTQGRFLKKILVLIIDALRPPFKPMGCEHPFKCKS